jgi:uncharacterized protein YneF (UPF0154 family)
VAAIVVGILIGGFVAFLIMRKKGKPVEHPTLSMTGLMNNG